VITKAMIDRLVRAAEAHGGMNDRATSDEEEQRIEDEFDYAYALVIINLEDTNHEAEGR
jgi:hypothetical protein